MGPRFLVTGATGFIGRRVVDRLLEEFGAHSLVCLTKPPATPLEAEIADAYRGRGLRLIEADMRNSPLAADPPPSVSTVFHLAANVNTDASAQEACVNDLGTQHLLDWLQPAAPGMRIVYASTVAVHDRDSHPVGAINEDSPLVPRTEYGRSKLRGERIIQARAARDGFTWTILRLPTVYGPGQKPGGLFDRLIAGTAAGAWPARIDWPGRTSILHVDDAAAIMIDLAARPDAGGEVYCVASESLTVGELAARIAERSGHPTRMAAIGPQLLRIARAVVWNPALLSLLPTAARRACWRLSLMVSDGFWFDTTKFRAAYSRPLRSIDEGLAEMLQEARGAGLLPLRGKGLVGC